jgi:SSS family solute:Na+ symporter
MTISLADAIVFFLYLTITLVIGYWAGRREKTSARQYFLAGYSLPWYAVGLSMVSASISTEQFIGEVGFAYTAGLSVANWELGVFPAFMILVWVLLPIYLRQKLFTIPEYLEQRFGRRTRTLFAGVTLLNYALINLAGVVYLAGFALHQIFNLPLYSSAVVLTVITGGYAVYGGLRSVAWTDVFQAALLLIGGLVVFFFGMDYVGWNWSAIVSSDPSRAHIIAPLSHPHFPWTGAVVLMLSTNVWYCCTNQFYIQRCLGARTMWDSRMGVLLACFLGIALAMSVCLPGLIAHHINPHLERADQAYMMLVSRVLPRGLQGVLLAAMVAAIMSTISSLINSTATVFSIDIYRDCFRRDASDRQLMRVGRLSGVAVVILACAITPLVGLRQNIFLYFQDCWAVLAVPISVVFVLGALWRRATPSAAWATMLLTLLYLPITFLWRSAEDLSSFEANGIPWLYNLAPGLWDFVHAATKTMHYFTFVCLLWLGTYLFMVVWSLCTRDPRAAEHGRLVWRPERLHGSSEERPRPWYVSAGFWSLALAGLFALIYGVLW